MLTNRCSGCNTQILPTDRFCPTCGADSEFDINAFQDEMLASITDNVRHANRRLIFPIIAVAGVFLLIESVFWGALNGLLSDGIIMAIINIGMLIVTASTAMMLKMWLRFPTGNISSWVISLVAWFVFVNIGREIGEGVFG